MSTHRAHTPLVTILGLIVASACSFEPERDPADYACQLPPDGHDPAHPRAERLQSFLDAQIEAGLPGVIYLARTPEGLWAGAAGHADLGTGTPMRSCNRSLIGSITKPLFATVVMRLVEDGLLDLDDRLIDLVPPGHLEGIANADMVILRQLLNHTSGIPNFTETLTFSLRIANNPGGDWSHTDRLDTIRNHPPLFAPGTEFSYTNTGYELLVPVIERATGKPHAQVLRELVLEPLELETIHYQPGDPRPPGVARGYSDLLGNGLVSDTTDYVISDGSPAGAAAATTHDLLAFIEALMAGEILGEVALSTMKSWRLVPPNPYSEADWPTSFGLGLMRFETPYGDVFGHSGGKIGYAAHLFTLPAQETTMVALLNGSGGQVQEVVNNDFLEAALAVLFE